LTGAPEWVESLADASGVRDEGSPPPDAIPTSATAGKQFRSVRDPAGVSIANRPPENLMAMPSRSATAPNARAQQIPRARAILRLIVLMIVHPITNGKAVAGC